MPCPASIKFIKDDRLGFYRASILKISGDSRLKHVTEGNACGTGMTALPNIILKVSGSEFLE